MQHQGNNTPIHLGNPMLAALMQAMPWAAENSSPVTRLREQSTYANLINQFTDAELYAINYAWPKLAPPHIETFMDFLISFLPKLTLDNGPAFRHNSRELRTSNRKAKEWQ